MNTVENLNTSGIDIRIGDNRDIIKQLLADNIQFDAILTDPPYEIALHGKSWDQTGIATSVEFWSEVSKLLKPGGYLVSFSASRVYHRVAIAIEDAGLRIHPMLNWEFSGGLPKPANLAKLFDRDNIKNRKIVGEVSGSGFTKANETHGAQQRLTTTFTRYERGASEEGARWQGYYYGINTFLPNQEPMVLAQKPISEKRMIDNVRKHGVGAINVGVMREASGQWPTPTLRHAKAKAKDHLSGHPSVKPVGVMEDLIKLFVPEGGSVLDPFAGTGTTGMAAKNLGRTACLIEQDVTMECVIKRRCGIFQ